MLLPVATLKVFNLQMHLTSIFDYLLLILNQGHTEVTRWKEAKNESTAGCTTSAHTESLHFTLHYSLPTTWCVCFWAVSSSKYYLRHICACVRARMCVCMSAEQTFSSLCSFCSLLNISCVVLSMLSVCSVANWPTFQTFQFLFQSRLTSQTFCRLSTSCTENKIQLNKN